MGQAGVKAIALLALLAASLGGAQKLPWENGDAQGAKQFVKYLFPEQVSIGANTDSVVELHFARESGVSH